MKKISFNLLYEPWIPCITLEGEPALLSIKDALVKAHTLREIQGETPLVIASIYRLLLAILHRVFGPEKRSTWVQLWEEGQWNAGALQNYFNQWEHRFDLFDEERPFFQAPDDRVRPKSTINLAFHFSSGNNATLFDHSTEEVGKLLFPHEAVQMLLVTQYFGLAGLSGLTEKFTDGPLARGIVFIVKGNSLFETLCLNLVRYKDGDQDKPCWEMNDPYSPVRVKPLGYLDYLTWQSRRVLLIINENSRVKEMTVAPGLHFNSNLSRNGEFFENTYHYRKDKNKGYLVTRFQEEKAIWRDSASLFAMQDSNTYKCPEVFGWLADHIEYENLSKEYQFQVNAFGMANNQMKVEFYRHDAIPLPLVYLCNPEYVLQLKECLGFAEDACKKLWGATKQLATLTLTPTANDLDGRKPDPKDVSNLMEHWKPERYYWAELELHFYDLLVGIPKEAKVTKEFEKSWIKDVSNTAREAFEKAELMAGTNTSALKAAVAAKSQLEIGLSIILPSIKEEST